MTRLTKDIYLYTPDHSTPSQPSYSSPVPPPELILFASWMGAGDKHIAKYITRYQALYPTAQILLVKSDPQHVLIPSLGARAAAPATSIIRSIIPDDHHGPEPRLLVHAMSNAGSAVKSGLYTAFAASGGGADGQTAQPQLPLHCTVFDSTPGEFTYRGSVAAYGATLPPGWRRAVALPLVHLLVIVYWVWNAVSGRDVLRYWGGRHNDRALVREARRSYVYSEEDMLIPWRAVERHAAEARQRGFEPRLEKFTGSSHVAHMVRDPERYWRVVRETWEGRAE